jgi:hypothetical protein
MKVNNKDTHIFANIRLGYTYLTLTNTLAYCKTVLIVTDRSSIVLTTGVGGYNKSFYGSK